MYCTSIHIPAVTISSCSPEYLRSSSAVGDPYLWTTQTLIINCAIGFHSLVPRPSTVNSPNYLLSHIVSNQQKVDDGGRAFEQGWRCSSCTAITACIVGLLTFQDVSSGTIVVWDKSQPQQQCMGWWPLQNLATLQTQQGQWCLKKDHGTKNMSYWTIALQIYHVQTYPGWVEA